MFCYFFFSLQTGRLLVGLRWWNYVDEEGQSHWVFESRKVIQHTHSKTIKNIKILVIFKKFMLLRCFLKFFKRNTTFKNKFYICKYL